jgi:biopolymer transport protein ExbD
MSNKHLTLVLAIIVPLWLLTALSLIFPSGLYLPLASSIESKRAQQTQQINRITVMLEADGDILLQGQPIELETLKESVESLVRNKQENLVILHSDKTVHYTLVVEILDRLRQIQGVEVALAMALPDRG